MQHVSDPHLLAERAIALHRAGDAKSALPLYRTLFAERPQTAGLAALLARALCDCAEGPAADAMFVEAASLAPDWSEPVLNLGRLAAGRGDHVSAVDCLAKAAVRWPSDPRPSFYCGNSLVALGRSGEAEAMYRETLRRDPAFVEALLNLGHVLGNVHRQAEAEACFREAIGLEPRNAAAWNNLGSTLLACDRLAEAETCFRRSLALRPEHASVLSNLAVVLQRTGRLAEAELLLREATRLAPDDPGVWNNLGNTFLAVGRPDEAEACLRRALALGPDATMTLSNIGIALTMSGKLVEAETCFRRAIAIEPALIHAHYNLGRALLQAGRLDEGWEEYEWRWETMGQTTPVRRAFDRPLWRGEPLEARILLLHAEQGLGDTIQFCRYAALAGRRGGRVILEVPRPLLRLMETLEGVEQVVAAGDKLPDFDLHCPLLSAPRAFGTTLETIPDAVPYLAASPAAVARWRERLSHLRGLTVGLVWSGNPARHSPFYAEVDRRRSIPLEMLRPLAEIGGVDLVSLQKDELSAEVATLADRMTIHDWTGELGDFADTAALVQALDLVVSVDTSVAHLAGALGKPVWLLNRFDTCWRWLQDRADSPWYPGLTQFRQQSPNDWAPVVQAVTRALAQQAREYSNRFAIEAALSPAA